MFRSEIGSGFEDPGGTPPPRIPRSTPPGHQSLSHSILETCAYQFRIYKSAFYSYNFHIFRLFGFGKEEVDAYQFMYFCHDHHASYVLMCRCCFLADNLEICATNTRMSYSVFAWIPLKFCFDLPVKRCAGDRD